MKITYTLLLLLQVLIFANCSTNKQNDMKTFEKGTFGYDLNFLSEKDSLIILKNETDAQVIVSARYQAKVFTSTTSGAEGQSLGFIKYDAFDYDTPNEHMNAFGGENRFWLGPEGGQYSVYFKANTEQVYDNWHTPKPIDIEPWDLVSASNTKTVMKKDMEVENYVGTKLKINVEREIVLHENKTIENLLNIKLDETVKVVGYSTKNTIKNNNDFEWTKETGTICIWILDMFVPAPRAVTLIPYYEGEEKDLGNIATSDYFGEIASDRLVKKDGMLYFKTDGKSRGKLGMNAKRTKAIAGNYDPDSKRLTITTYDVEKDAVYLNQEWNIERNPLVGDAMNAYNDGPIEDGSTMGPFLEIESASPAAFISPQQSQVHNHNVYHFIGDIEKLNPIAEKLLGTKLNDLDKVFR